MTEVGTPPIYGSLAKASLVQPLSSSRTAGAMSVDDPSRRFAAMQNGAIGTNRTFSKQRLQNRIYKYAP
jgi:hypothetical protein